MKLDETLQQYSVDIRMTQSILLTVITEIQAGGGNEMKQKSPIC